MRDIKRIFVHCTAGSQKQTKNDLLREFKAKGWSAPGYHYVVFPDGKVEQLLAEDKVSNGVQGYNSTAINVAYVGGIDSKGKAVDNRTDDQKDALAKLVQSLKLKYPNAHIMGHRDIWGKNPKNWKKQCPCFDATSEYAFLDGAGLSETSNAEAEYANVGKKEEPAPIVMPLFAQPEVNTTSLRDSEEPKQSLWSKIKSYFPWNQNK